MDIYTKTNANTLGVVKTKPVEILPIKMYDYGFLKQQLINIQKQKDDFNILRDAEILEIQTLLNEANKLGIVEKIIIVEKVISLEGDKV